MGGRGGMGQGGRGLKDRSKRREDEQEKGVKVEEKNLRARRKGQKEIEWKINQWRNSNATGLNMAVVTLHRRELHYVTLLILIQISCAVRVQSSTHFYKHNRSPNRKIYKTPVGFGRATRPRVARTHIFCLIHTQDGGVARPPSPLQLQPPKQYVRDLNSGRPCEKLCIIC